MSLKEGRCPNCGSILSVDSKSEKSHCLFCDAVFETSRSVEIAENPEGVAFPNEPQPPYEGPSLSPAANVPAGIKLPKPPPAKKEQPSRTSAKTQSYVQKEPIKLPEIKLTPRMRLQLILVFVVIIALIAAIGIPTVNRRDADRAEIVRRFDETLPVAVNAENAIAVRHVANDYVLLALPEDLDAQSALQIFADYCQIRATVRGEEGSDFQKVYGRVEMKILTPSGGYAIRRPASEAALSDISLVKTLR